MDSEYAGSYSGLYRNHWWWRAREELLVAELRRSRPEGGFGRILDVGCGDGLFFDRLAEFGAVSGVEPDSTTIDVAAPHSDRIHVGPFDDSYEPGGRYGLILMLDVLEHMTEPEQAIRKAIGLLEPQGKLLVTVPAFNLLWTRHDDYNHHLTRYTSGSFTAMATRAGLRLDRRRYFFHWTFAAKLVARAIESISTPEAKSPRVPPAPINMLLYGLSRLEQVSLGWLPVPFGSSLLVVGGRARIT